MKKQIEYKEALEKIAFLEDKIVLVNGLNVFDRSLVLAVLFNKDKKECLEDLLNLRKDKFGIVPKRK